MLNINMPRYINADLAPIYLNAEACEQIKQMPTANVQEVKHGYWIKEELLGCEPYYLCSVCGKLHYQEYSYCNNCGAKMDGREKIANDR